MNCKYLSRSDFASTYTDRQIQLPTDNERLAKGRAYKTGAVDQEEMPTFGVDKGLYLVTKEDGTKATSSELSDRKNLKYNDDLIDRLTSDYNSSLWDDLVSQASTSEVRALVEKSGFGSAAIESIGKPSTLDFDGPSGFNENTQKIAEDKSNWTSYPPECVIGCSWNVELANEIGKSMAFEASKSGINGWYAPGVNLHRSNFNGRNYEYYSEDPRISGKLASATITGAKSGGLYCYLKHFVVSEEGDNPKGVDTWLTEQNLRENYLKPFEMAVKSGANAIMTAFGRVGCVWAGASYDLLTEILRNEWGFKGNVTTDFGQKQGSLMEPQLAYEAGTTMFCTSGAGFANYLKGIDITKDYKIMSNMREAIHRNLYNFANSAAMNGMTSSSKVVPVRVWYQNALLGLEIGSGIILGLSLLMLGLQLYFISKEKE